MRTLNKLFVTLISILILPSIFVTPAAGEMLTVTLDAGDYEITEDEQGLQRIIMEGFGSLVQPGEPWLPGRIFYIALPPKAEVHSVTVEGIAFRELPGTYQLAPKPPMLPQMEIDPQWLQSIKRQWEARRREVYDSDAPFPAEAGRYVGTGGLRKYTFARVSFTPFVYYPKSGRLIQYSGARVTIDYTAPGMTDEVRRLLSDRKMEDRAAEILVNYHRAQHWYPRAIPEGKQEDYDYVIITPASLEAACDSLETWKEQLGYDVKVVTTAWIDTAYTGTDIQEKIRNFLIDKYLDADWGIEYVLIAADDDSIPMRRCFPDPTNHRAASDTTTPTDYYYAELSQPDSLSWDSDGDGFPGEFGQDNVDFVADVYVGRILSNDGDEIHNICRKLVEFEGEDASSWKYDALLLGAFSNFTNEDTTGWARTDGAELMEDMISDMLGGMWSTTTMYEKAGLDTSNYLCDQALTHNNVVNDWSTGTYGIVNWWAHGSPDTAWRKWWSTDDGDSIPEAGEMSWQGFIGNADAPSLDNDHPSIVFANSCRNGWPEVNCLAKNLLAQGSAGMVASTRDSWYIIGWTGPGDGGNASLDYYFFDELLNHDKKLGEALFDAKVVHDTQHGFWWWEQMNLFDFCLYGEPSLIWQGAIPAADTISNDTTWTISQSPYIVENMLYIRGTDGPDNVTTLTINPGVRVVFGPMGGLTVGSSSSSKPGALVADGKSDSIIVFTSISDTTKNEPNDWQWIKFLDYSDDNTCLLDHCLIEYPYEGIFCSSASPTISNCLIRNVWSGGIRLYSNSDPSITNTVIHDCASEGILCRSGSDPTLYGDSIAVCLRGLDVDDSSPSVDSCFFVNNNDLGINLWESAATVSNSQVRDNGSAGIGIADSSSPVITGCQISNNEEWGILVGWGSTVEIYDNTITQHDSLPAIEINGPLDTAKVYSNTLTDNKEALVLDCGWYGSPSEVYYNTIQNNNYGVIVNDTAAHSIHHNDILDNSVRNLHNDITDTLTAEYNWWGATRADSIEAFLAGPIDYVPFLTNTFHAPWVEVTYPNGGEILADSVDITWVAPDLEDDSVSIDILYSYNGGSSWNTEATDEPNDSTYTWDTKLGPDSEQYLIKLKANDGTYTSWDISDAVFTVYNPDPPQVTVTYPNGGELLIDSVDVTWTATDPDLGDSTILSVDLEYSADAGTTWSVVDSNQANDGTYGWNISELDDGTEYLIRIAVTDTSGLSDTDSSDAVFEINNPDPPQVTVLSPNGGEHWSGSHDIVWTASDPDSAEGLTFDLYVGIATLTDTTWTQLLSNSSDTSYSWNTIGYPDWHTCYVKVEVTDPDELTDVDLSNNSFVVDNTPPPMPSYLYLDAEWDFSTNLGKVYLTWEDVTDTLSPPETFQVYYGTSDATIDYENPILTTSSNSCTIDSLSPGPHYFGLSVHDAADQPNEVVYQKSKATNKEVSFQMAKGTNGEGVYFTTGADANLATVVANSNGVVTGSSPNFQLDGSLVLTYPNFMMINFENLTAGDSDGHHTLIVYGRLVAHRSTFSASNAGDWRGIVFADSSMDYDTLTTVGCLVDSCTIRHAVEGIHCIRCSPLISGNEIDHNSFAGIKCFWSGALIQDNDALVGGIHHNAYGIYVDGEGPMISGITAKYNDVRDNSTAGMHFGAQAQPFIHHNLIHDNTDGVQFETWAFPAQFDRNDIYNNTGYGVINDTTSVLVTAENNWWGDASGPSGVGSGSGDAVSKNVDYRPFLTFRTGSDVVNWCRLISPSNITMDVGDTTEDITGQVYEPGITPGVGQGAGITAQVGYGSDDSQPSGTGWKWANASYSGDVGDNDEYTGNLTVSRAGTYDYAYRFSLDAGSTWVYADLDGNNTGGEGDNGYTTDQAGDLQVGHVLNAVLLVDDDLGGYQMNYMDALDDNGVGYDVWEVSIDGSPPASVLNKYQAVVWETGEDDASTLTSEDEDNLMAYLDNGGNLFLSSKGYLTEILVPNLFSTDYLHVDTWINDVTGIEREQGEPGDPISDGLSLQLLMPLCVGTDDMTPGVDAVGILHNDYYKSGKQLNFGGLRYPTAAGKSSYRVVFFCFPFESIMDEPDPNNQSTVMGRVMNWLITGCLPPEALMAGDKYPGYVPLTWSPPGSAVDTLLIHDGTMEGRIRASGAGNVLAVGLTPEDYPCILRTLMFHVWDIQPMTAVDMYVFADTSADTTSAPGPPIAGPYEVITRGHGDGWVFVDVWDDQITVDSADVYVGVAYRDSLDTGVSADRTPPFHDRGWWGQSVNGPWDLLSDYGWPFNVSDPSISAVVTYEDGSSKLLGGPPGSGLVQFGTATADQGSKAFLGYNVYRGESGGGPYVFLEFVPQDQTTYDDSTVIGGKPYWYVVSSTYHQEETGYCNEDQGTPRSILPPEAVDDLDIALEINDLHLSWSPVSLDTAGYPKEVEYYTIYRKSDPYASMSEGDSVGSATETFFVDQGAAGDTLVQYFYVVKAVDCDGAKSAESNRVGEFDKAMSNGTK